MAAVSVVDDVGAVGVAESAGIVHVAGVHCCTEVEGEIHAVAATRC